MSSRPLSVSSRAEEVYNDFQREVLAEKAASLGRAGKALEVALGTLRETGASEDRDALVQAAADAAHVYLIQREAAGTHGLGSPLEDFGVPGEVRVRIGARPSPPPAA
jgi:hypothetical protein